MPENFMERSLAGYSPWGPRELDTTEGLNTDTHTHKGSEWPDPTNCLQSLNTEAITNRSCSSHCEEKSWRYHIPSSVVFSDF